MPGPEPIRSPEKTVTPIESQATARPEPLLSAAQAIRQIEPAKVSKAPPPTRQTGPTSAPAPKKSARAVSEHAEPSIQLPPILLEGDEPVAPVEPFRTSPHEVVRPAELEEGHLPEGYGTGRLALRARDPHSIYAYWDFTREQQNYYCSLSADKRLVLLVWQAGVSQRLLFEIALHTDSRHWFVHVPDPGGTYNVELGYYDHARQWCTVAVSEPVQTPGTESLIQPAREPEPIFANICIEPEPVVIPRVPGESEPAPRPAITPAPIVEIVQHPPAPDVLAETQPAARTETPLPLSARLEEPGEPATQTRTSQEPRIDDLNEPSQTETTTEQLQPRPTGPALTAEEQREVLYISQAENGPVVAGSIEVVDLLQRLLRGGGAISSLEALEFGVQSEARPEAIVSSPGAPPAQSAPSGFWMNVNAELVIYGATEPDARVTIGGRPIRLRPDGSFSYRFSLPDGRYELPIRAVSADSTEMRGASLQFWRGTDYEGSVEQHPQDPSLVPPEPSSIPQ